MSNSQVSVLVMLALPVAAILAIVSGVKFRAWEHPDAVAWFVGTCVFATVMFSIMRQNMKWR